MAQLTIQQAFELAVQHHQADRLQEAERIYRQILSEQPNHAEALHWLGLLAYQVGRHDVAVNLIGRAVAYNPNQAVWHCNFGIALAGNGQLDEAMAEYRRSIALDPSFAEVHCNLGNALREKGRMDDAIAANRAAIALRHNFPEAHINMGIALKARGRLDEAIAAFREAIALRSTYAEAYCNLGDPLLAKGQVREAMAAFRQAIALKPTLPEAYCNLGSALISQGELDEAVVVLQQAIALRPGYPSAYCALGNAFKDGGRVDDAIAAFRQAILSRPGYSEAHSSLVYTLHVHPDCDAQVLAEEHCRWNLQHAEPLKVLIKAHGNDRNPERRLRIGYVSPDFREHAVGRFLLPLLEHHNKSQVQVFAYAQVSVPDAMTQSLRAHTDEWRDIVGLTDADVAEVIRQDQIDVLVDLAMHTAGNRLLVFARKPAPVQVSYLAYCSSTGLDAIDYRISDPYLDPPGEDESVYSERTIRVGESYWCYQPSDVAPAVNPLPALARDKVTFGCLNNFCKINERTLEIWSRILRMSPKYELLLHAKQGSHRQWVRERLGREGIEPARVRYVGSVAMGDYFGLYHEIDIALDTFPYGGGTTSCDALWMGVPVITLVGATAVGRAGLSILSNTGLPEFVARTPEEYVRLAIELANDIPRLQNLRLTLRQRMQESPLMDAPRFAGNVEAAYRQMWKTWCETIPSNS